MMKLFLSSNLFAKSKNVNIKQILFLMLLMGVSLHVKAQTTVNSLPELWPYLKQSNIKVKLALGEYTISAKDIQKRHFSDTKVVKNYANVLFLFWGNSSAYDFSDVTINVETKVMTTFKKEGSELFQIQIIVNNNVLKNLTLVDVGSVHDTPTRRATDVVMDGANNRIEGLHLSTKGSYPYGYRDVFGKGGKTIIKHRKHSAFLIRDFQNHVKNCTIIHRAYGHALFMQAADEPLIEGCYIEGEMRTTDDILAEEGTGSDADKIDFKTIFGYRLKKGYTIGLGEAGIRAYNGGETIINGVEYRRGTSNPTIINCTVKNMRTGITLTHATGKKYVKGCTLIGNERGFCIGSGDIIDCYVDTQYGPALGVDYITDEGTNADITLLPYEGSSYNGSQHAAIIIGSNHKIILRSEIELEDQNLKINIGGDNKTKGRLKRDENYTASNIILHSFTKYPVILDENSKNNTGISKGNVINKGFNNHIFKTTN